MKTKITLLLLMFSLCTLAQSNIPQLVSFSAVVRDANNIPLVNTNVSIRLTFKQGGQNGPMVYCALYQTTTNQNGFMSLLLNREVLGTSCNGAPNTNFENIPWENGNFWMEVEYQTVPNTPFESLGQLELASSIYAFAAGTAERLTNFNLSNPSNGDVIVYNAALGQWVPGQAQGASFQNLSVSNSGDTLYISNGNWVIIPGISAANGGSSSSGTVGGINCGSATNTGTLTAGLAASGVSSSIPYTGGNGGAHSGQTVSSTGVTGLTATLTAGSFANGSGNLTYTITGTPSGSGTANFAINVGGQSCTLSFNTQPGYPAGYVHCNGIPTAIVEVTNPITGRTWMDRNLGASQVAINSQDESAYGDLYQWGRRADGHQCRTSPTTSVLSNTNQPGHGNFILAPNSPNDWRSPQNESLWQGSNGANNPCPIGYHVPSLNEWTSEVGTWNTLNSQGAFLSLLKMTNAGIRIGSNGSFEFIDIEGFYWMSNANSGSSNAIWLTSTNVYNASGLNRSNGATVRCIKD